MTAFTAPTPRKLTKKEAEEVALLEKVLKKLGKYFPCKDYSPMCSNCVHYVLMGQINWYIDNIKF